MSSLLRETEVEQDKEDKATALLEKLRRNRECSGLVNDKVQAAKIAGERAYLALQNSMRALDAQLQSARDAVDAIADGFEVDSDSDDEAKLSNSSSGRSTGNLHSSITADNQLGSTTFGESTTTDEHALSSLFSSSSSSSSASPPPPLLPPAKDLREAFPLAVSDILSSPNLCIAMLIRDAPISSLHSFIRYHKLIGFAKIYFFFDDVNDDYDDKDYRLMQAAASYTDMVKVVHCGSEWFKKLQHKVSQSTWNLHGDYLTTDLIARQVLALEQAIQMSCDDEMDWILHIDIDELIYWPPQSGGVSRVTENIATDWFSRISPHVDALRFFNSEAAPENCELTGEACDYFQEISLFKMNPSTIGSKFSFTLRKNWPPGRVYFTAYQNGKSAVRCQRDIIPKGSHGFVRKSVAGEVDSMLLSMDAQQICEQAVNCPPPQILHYPHASFALWKRKYNVLGVFPDVWCGQKKIPKESFHLQSRDVFSRFCSSGDPSAASEARDLFLKHVVFSDRCMNTQLLEQGLLVRYTDVAVLIRRMHEGSHSYRGRGGEKLKTRA